jgi:nickel/cobalt transporter (NiCoT) family protein
VVDAPRIVLITSIVVAATASAVSQKFGAFSQVGGTIGTSVSAGFLILLGLMNAYILYKLIVQLRKIIDMHPDEGSSLKIEGGGCIFWVLKRLFKLIDR